MSYLRLSIHSVSACEPRPSAASIAALYPRLAWSLDTTPLVRGFSSRSARKPATASEKWPMSTDERALFCPGQLFLTALHAVDSLARHDVGAVCHAGRVDIVLPPHWLHRRPRPALGTVTVSGRASTLTSADRLQFSHVAITARTPFCRLLASVIGDPGLERMSGAPIARAQL